MTWRWTPGRCSRNPGTPSPRAMVWRARADARAPGPRARGARRRVTSRDVLVVVVAGLATGILTQLGQGLLPDGWRQIANAISPWLLVAFLVGSRMADVRWAAAAGVAT